MTARYWVLGVTVLSLSGSAPSSPPMGKVKFTVDTEPVAEGRVLVNGTFVGIAPAQIELNMAKGAIAVIRAEKAGAIFMTPVRMTEQDLKKNRLVKLRLEPDESFTETVSAEVANTWLTIEPTSTKDADGDIDQDKVWSKMVSIVTDNFPDVEHMDRGSYYLRTAWRTRQYALSVVRSRLVVKMGAASSFAIKVQLESQRALKKSSADKVTDEMFEPYDRVMKRDKETLDFLRDQL